MKKINEREREYVYRIDNAFPHDNEQLWKSVIEEGISISDNAAYMALLEILSGIGLKSKPPVKKMFDYWYARYDHPTKEMITEAAKAIFEGKSLSEDKALEYLKSLSNYTGLYNAAEIVYHAGPEDSKRVLEKLKMLVWDWDAQYGFPPKQFLER